MKTEIKKPEIWSAQARRVQKKFERWRAAKQGREKIPPSLWEAAAKLCEIYSVGRVSRGLKLDHTALKKIAGGKLLNPRSHRSKTRFVEWKVPGSGPSSAEYVVEVGSREDEGQRIHVRGASVSEVAALSRELRLDGSGN